jgi:hypothetical protein
MAHNVCLNGTETKDEWANRFGATYVISSKQNSASPGPTLYPQLTIVRSRSTRHHVWQYHVRMSELDTGEHGRAILSLLAIKVSHLTYRHVTTH